MQLFAEYVQPATIWLSNNPNWALFITFIISFLESLAIIGSIVPGSVTMTAIGIMAGSGVMRVDLTFLSAILGAIAGDSASYFLGYFFSERLIKTWPFKSHPKWLEYGKSYFEQHGGKSVLLGRFIGPLRSIIPIVAGMMKMRQSRFLIANSISAVGWALLYVMPGVLIGAASSELSNETATKLFVGVLLTLLAIWLIGVGLKWIFVHSKTWLDKNFHHLGVLAKKHPYMQASFLWITPQTERDHAPTIFLIISILALAALYFLMITFQCSNWMVSLDQGVYYFFKSIRSLNLDKLIFVILTTTSAYVTLFFYLLVLISIALHKEWRTVIFWLLLPVIVFISNYYQCTSHICSTRIQPVATSLCLEQAWLSALTVTILMHANYGYRQVNTGLASIVFFGIIGLSGLASLYLVQLSLSKIIIASVGGTLSAILLWLFYRRRHIPSNQSLPKWFGLFFIATTIFATALSFIKTPILKDQFPLHGPYQNITQTQWWMQDDQKLPVLRRNRWGVPVSYLNIQYVGSLKLLKLTLQRNGWLSVKSHFLQSLLARLKADDQWFHRLPLLPQLHDGRSPSLVMTKEINDTMFVIRLWASNHQVNPDKKTLYVGSIHQSYIEQKKHFVSDTPPINILAKILGPNYDYKVISLPKSKIKPLIQMPSSGLIIKHKPGN